jgi:peptidoglycan/LPS O-acetylase OafA/YrhL
MKPHYPILDGLRGTAAILVVIFHLFEGYYPVMADHPMHHGYLAVDFFYLLSGFVVGYAYDDRWGKMTVKDFFKIRLVRLHPMVILGTLVGTVAYWFDPYTNMAHTVGILKLLGVMVISFTLMPAPDVRNWNETHPLDGPCWSLLQEYIANIIYAFWGRYMSKTTLWIVVIITGIMLTATAVYNGHLGTGWGFDNFWIAPIRMLFPFFAGLLLFRSGKLIKIPMAYPLCSVILLILFCVPVYSFNGYYEAACIILIFPWVVAIAAGSDINGRWLKLCSFSGAISYPIYLLHYPFIYIYTTWIAKEKPAPGDVVPVAVGLFVLFMVMAWVALKYYDEPVRAYLKRKYLTAGKVSA